VGMAIYFSYGQRHSRLNEKFADAKAAVDGRTATAEANRDDDDENVLTKA